MGMAIKGLPVRCSRKESACRCKETWDVGLTPGSGRLPGIGNGREEPGGLWSTVSQGVGHSWGNWACQALSPWNFQARIQEQVAISFSTGSSRPRDRTQVSCIAGGFFIIWATTEAWAHKCGYKRATWGMLALVELIYILTVSVLVSSLWYCTTVLQGNVTGENFIVFYNCMWIGKIPWRREGQPTPAFVPWEFHGQRSLVGHSSWCHKEMDTAGGLTHTCESAVNTKNLLKKVIFVVT